MLKTQGDTSIVKFLEAVQKVFPKASMSTVYWRMRERVSQRTWYLCKFIALLEREKGGWECPSRHVHDAGRC